MYSINCKGKLLTFDKPLVMGIINATPDSFFQGHLSEGQEGMLLLAKKMIEEGADIIDVGGQSTRPGSKAISGEEEMSRVLPVIKTIHTAYPDVIISVDTYYSCIAEQAVTAGASIVNDISGGNLDNNMLPAVAALEVPYICMHMQGLPSTMQHSPVYENVTQEVLDYFIVKAEQCRKAGIKDIIIDPGFGFGKTADHNYELLNNLSVFSIINKPLLVGLSRKGMIHKILGITPGEALNGTTVLNTIALLNGAQILRVHDVKQAKEVISLIDVYKKASSA